MALQPMTECLSVGTAGHVVGTRLVERIAATDFECASDFHPAVEGLLHCRYGGFGDADDFDFVVGLNFLIWHFGYSGVSRLNPNSG